MEGPASRSPKRSRDLKILVAEDERPARQELIELLGDLLPEADISEAKDGHEALAIATQGGFDVCFLDIEMPGLDGLAVATRLLELREPPRLVFCTAIAAHAVEAFRLAALDYVLKPLQPERLKETVERLLGEQEYSLRQREAVGKYVQGKAIPQIWAESAEESWVLLDYDSIYWVEAAGRSVTLHAPDYPSLRVKMSLKDLETRLEPHGFVRVHKAYLVNTSKVTRMRAWFSGSFVLSMADSASTEIPLSRRYASGFKKSTGWE